MSDRRQPRLKEIADRLGLSITTVSRALNGYTEVSEASRERIFATAKAMGYVPNQIGRMLASGKTGLIGLPLPVRDGRMMDGFLGEFVAGLAEGLVARGRDLMIATVAGGQSDLDVIRRMVDGRRVDAMVINRTTVDDPRVALLLERGFPFVVHGRVLGAEADYSWYDTDGEAAFTQAVDLLAGLGHRRFGFFGASEIFTFAVLRRRGFERAIRAAGLAFNPDAQATAAPFDDEAVRVAADRLVGVSPRPTAILCATDTLAIAVIEAARRAGLSVPRDLSVVGFDDVPVAGFTDPPLSTFDQHSRASARAVADMVADLVDGDGRPQTRLVKADFVSRGSHGPAPPNR
jgi:LacI family transcriptional regulator